MKKIILVALLAISANVFGQGFTEVPIPNTGRNYVAYTKGMVRIDSIFAFADKDTTTVRAAFPTMRMNGRVAFQEGVAYYHNGVKFVPFGPNANSSIANQSDTTQTATFKIDGTGTAGNLVATKADGAGVVVTNTNTTTTTYPFLSLGVTGQNTGGLSLVPRNATISLNQPWTIGARGTSLLHQSPGNTYFRNLKSTGLDADYTFYVSDGSGDPTLANADSLFKIKHDGTAYLYHAPALGTGDTVLKWNSYTKALERVVVASSGVTQDVLDDSTAAIRADFPEGGVSDGDKGDITVTTDGDVWTIDNLAVNNAKIATGIDAAKLADGTVSNAELQRINSVTSNVQDQIDGKVNTTGSETIAGVKTFSSDPIIPDESYGSGWNGVLEPPTKNAVYDKIEALPTDPTLIGAINGATQSMNYSFPSNAYDADFVVDAFGIARVDGSWVLNDPIPWVFLTNSDGHGSSFFTGISVDAGAQELDITYPYTKHVFNVTVTLDESFAGKNITVGPTVEQTKASFRAYHTRPLSVRISGDGAGGWSKSGDGAYLEVSTFNTGDGSTSFNIDPLAIAPSEPSIIYNGPNGYTIDRAFSGLGSYNYKFILRKPDLSALNTNPTSSDHVVIPLGLVPYQVNLASFNISNTWLASSFNFWVTGRFELWLIAKPSGTGANVVRWQTNYPSATDYKIYRDTDPAFGTQVLIHTGTSGTYLDTGLASNTLYYYKMVAVVGGVDTDVTTFRCRAK